MNLADFQYRLPHSLIAQYPSRERDQSRLMVLHRDTGSIEHRTFCDLAEYLNRGDVLVVNDTKVLKARLLGNKKTGGKVEVLITERVGDRIWKCMVKRARSISYGSKVLFGDGLIGKFLGRDESGSWRIEFHFKGDFYEAIDEWGQVPLPPYIKRKKNLPFDEERYQTIFATEPGSIAAPTAGLHFTHTLLQKVRQRDVSVVSITLHVNAGTFLPIRTKRVEDHKMAPEYCKIGPRAVEAINMAKGRGGKIIAVGTTTTRSLESAVDSRGKIVPIAGYSDLFIHPPFRFRIVDALVTNFHLPGTTLLLLVSAFAPGELIMKAYEEAIRKEYRFFSYGDGMLIL
ncbi:MAG: tRNA preQ1(34) S-adenosylmethionine ribosyltransferase-isomerase QueA [Syntrophobacterales bacterium]|nr:MAG: tRNA preQ1(34) S-adenosylmethionine ribosyltransferase-isomerase QueA [Syntrophobacterales bacterium]